jgi:hypothetical protein
MRIRRGALIVTFLVAGAGGAGAVSDGQYTTHDQGCTEHAFAQGPSGAEHGQDATPDHCQAYRLSAGTDNNGGVVRIGLDHEEPDAEGFNGGHVPHHGTTHVGSPGEEIVTIHYGTGVTELPVGNPITGQGSDGPYSDDHKSPELEVSEPKPDNTGGIDTAAPGEAHVYQGGDDNLESGEHDGIPDETTDSETGETYDNRDLQDGPSDGSAQRVDVTPHEDDPAANVDPSNPYRDPLPAAYAGAGVCTDGSCVSAGTRERRVWDGSSEDRMYADNASSDDFKDTGDYCDQNNESNCVRTIHDSQSDFYTHPGVTIYNDPDPQDSQAIPFPGNDQTTHAGTGGIEILGTSIVDLD